MKHLDLNTFTVRSMICLQSFNQLLFVFVSQEEIYLSIGLIFHKLTLSGQTIQVTQYRPRYTIVKTLVQNVLQLSVFFICKVYVHECTCTCHCKRDFINVVKR